MYFFHMSYRDAIGHSAMLKFVGIAIYVRECSYCLTHITRHVLRGSDNIKL